MLEGSAVFGASVWLRGRPSQRVGVGVCCAVPRGGVESQNFRLGGKVRPVWQASPSPERCMLLLSCSLLALCLADCRLATTRVH